MPNQKSVPSFEEFMNKVKQVEKGEKLDLSSGEDLSIAIMNLISLEEHLFFSGGKTGKTAYYDLIPEIREMRKALLKQIVKEYEGEVWCMSKHLLAASMRVMEVATKLQTKGDTAGANDLFQKSYNLYSLFWGMNLGLVGADAVVGSNEKPSKKTSVRQLAAAEIAFVSDDEPPKDEGSVSIFARLGQVVKKAIDCCRE